MLEFNREEYINSISDIINGIARRSAYKFKTRDALDIAQELWLEVLEKENKSSSLLDFNLVAKICYDKIVDLQRYDSLRNSISYEDLSESKELKSHKDNIDDILTIQQLYSSFPEGSEELKFLEYWMTASGFKDFGYRPSSEYKGGYTESNLSKILGYKGTSDRRFVNFRSRMRRIIKEFLKDSD